MLSTKARSVRSRTMRLLSGMSGMDLVIELAAEPDNKAAAAMDKGRVAFVLDAEGEGVLSRLRAASAFP